MLFQLMQPRTRSELANLKLDWVYDPIWDIETTPGFEAHTRELLDYRFEQEARWQQGREDRLAQIAEGLGVPGNLRLAAKFEALEARIKVLENVTKYLPRGE